MSSHEFDRYWNGVAWLPFGPNRIADDLDEVERREVLEQHERLARSTFQETYDKEFSFYAECDRVNHQIELASFETTQHTDSTIHSYESYADQPHNFYIDDWRFEHSAPEDYEYAMLELAPDDYIESELDPIDSVSATFMRYQRHGKFPGPKTHPEDDEWYEHPSLFLGEDD